MCADPLRFDRSSGQLKLLEVLFECGEDGVPVLLPAIRSNSLSVLRSVSFVLSELGSLTRPIVRDVAKLVEVDDTYVKMCAMEAVAVGAIGGDSDAFTCVLRRLEDSTAVVRRLAILLASRVDSEILAACSSGAGREAVLLRRYVLGNRPNAIQLTEISDSLERRYVAIGALRSSEDHLLESLRRQDDESVVGAIADVAALRTRK